MLKRSKKLHFNSLLTTLIVILTVLAMGFLRHFTVERERDQAAKSQRLIQDLSHLLVEFEKLEGILHEQEPDSYTQVVDQYVSTVTTIQFHFSHLVSSKKATLLEEPYFDSLQAKSIAYLKEYQNLMTLGLRSGAEEDLLTLYADLREFGVSAFISNWIRLEDEALSEELKHLVLFYNICFWTSILLLLFLAIFLILHARKVTAEFDNCDKAILQNRINNDVFEHIEKMAGMGHAYYSFEEKRLVFSTNLYRILGHTDTGAPPSFKMYLGRIYPSDREQVLSTLKSLTLIKNALETSARIILPDGTVKNVRMLGLVRNDERGRIAVFVTKDVTAEISSQGKLQELNASLSLQNRLFKHVESIASIGYYSHFIDTGRQMFSDNLFRLLGFAPDSFTASKNILLSHVLEEDKEAACAWTDPDLDYAGRLKDTIRVQDRYGTIKYLGLSREFFEDGAMRVLVVTLKDVSVEAAINRDLENKNKELFRSNAELESFNHIASHDLQEPIRKILTLISMLKSLPELSLTEKSEDYLGRIKRSASRMQLLILDLLKFSRVSHEDKKFEVTPLNNIVDTVLDELSLKIGEMGAEVNVAILPEASVIPSQMRQLFTNLIENALKFGKPDQKTIIDIFTEELTQQEKALFTSINSSNLLKISVKDNGMGFDPIHAERIFVIFNRLHDKKYFEGSGIGLAICKKVVENHGGVISAYAVPGDGAKFTFIIPTGVVAVALHN
ncbi:ATP-binding protein [Algoriphagus sp. AGSA1]|uniref:sensor histidine kinase n=1 Tax=Algoriphagus sp. AGSA1 TaxID=2907213 RepID=UPI001F1663A6|nr:ATP-binding protein [Algoriphagus sp. AGSA1]MCE7054669.1 ATP-binding protein [Algoriphagus sp. AGSA1]